MWWLTLFLRLVSSYAQLTPPSAAVCVGEQLAYVCHQSLDLVRWRVRLPGMISLAAVTPSKVGRIGTFPNDPGFGFQIITTSNYISNITSELRVTAARELDGVTVECEGFSETFMSTIQVAVVDPPAAPSDIVTMIVDKSYHTPRTVSITLMWFASSEADKYTIMVTPPLPSGQSLLFTTSTSLQLTVFYGEEYFVSITSQNCAGNRSTTIPIIVSLCGPANTPGNGYINSNYSSTVEGSQITFHCGGNSSVMTSTCTNGSWIPDPGDLECGSLPRDSDAGLYAGITVAILLLVTIATVSVMIVIIGIKKKGVTSKPLSLELDSYQDVNQDGSEYAHTRHLGPRINNHQANVEYSVLCHSIPSENTRTHPQGETLVYADIGPSSAKSSANHLATSNIHDDHRVVYSTLNLALHQPVKRSTHNKNGHCPADKSLDLDSLLIQLKPQVIDKWEQFAEAVGLSNLIQQLSKYSPDECIVEVFDQWLKSHPTKPTWKNVADVLHDIGVHQLAEDILKVYETGKLPIMIDMDAIPENLAGDNGILPPLPPKLEDNDSDLNIEPVQHGMERLAAVPPRPPKPPVRPPKSAS